MQKIDQLHKIFKKKFNKLAHVNNDLLVNDLFFEACLYWATEYSKKKKVKIGVIKNKDGIVYVHVALSRITLKDRLAVADLGLILGNIFEGVVEARTVPRLCKNAKVLEHVN